MLNLIHYYYIAHPFYNYFYFLLIFRVLTTQKAIITKSETLSHRFIHYYFGIFVISSLENPAFNINEVSVISSSKKAST